MRIVIAVGLILAGILLFTQNYSWGLLGSFGLIAVGLVIGIYTLLGGGRPRVTADSGPTRGCPQCRSRNPPDAAVCRSCGYRFPPRK